ncbi:hypothetical protein J6590_020563 [Homalodisca vitripennis]|nr:hypothetical protein J6590_020563 [Homalodisca vitripennis]
MTPRGRAFAQVQVCVPFYYRPRCLGPTDEKQGRLVARTARIPEGDDGRSTEPRSIQFIHLTLLLAGQKC